MCANPLEIVSRKFSKLLVLIEGNVTLVRGYTLLNRMSVLYSVPFKKNLAKALLTTLAGSLASGAAAPIAGSALKVIPGVGALVGGAGMARLGGASTYAIGRVFKQHFEKGGTLEDFDPKEAGDELKAQQEKASSFQENKSPQQK